MNPRYRWALRQEIVLSGPWPRSARQADGMLVRDTDLPSIGRPGQAFWSAWPGGADGALSEPQRSGRGRDGAGGAERCDDCGHVVRADVVRDHDAHGSEDAERDGQRGQDTACEGTGRDSEGHREQRIADRDNALDVELAGIEALLIEGILRAGPPGDEGRDGAAPGGCRE